MRESVINTHVSATTLKCVCQCHTRNVCDVTALLGSMNILLAKALHSGIRNQAVLYGYISVQIVC